MDLTQTTGSDRTVTSAPALLRMEGSREKQREAGDDALREGRNEKDIKEGERTDRERERRKRAIRGLPHTSGCDFGNCS